MMTCEDVDNRTCLLVERRDHYSIPVSSWDNHSS